MLSWVMPSVSVNGFDHLSLPCRRVKATRKFYESVLGFRVTARMPKWGMTELKTGNAAIVLVDLASRAGAWAKSHRGTGENMHHYCLRLKSFDEGALRTRLKRAKIAIEEEQHKRTPKGAEHAFYVRDPEGNCVELRGLLPKKRPPLRTRLA